MKKFFIITVSVICIISVLCFSCFATDTTTEPEVTISPLIDNTISKYNYVFYNINYGTSDYNILGLALNNSSHNSNTRSVGSCTGKTQNNNSFNNYPIFAIYNDNSIYVNIVNLGSYEYIQNIYRYEISVDNTSTNSFLISQFNTINNKIVTYEYSNVINSGFQNSLKILGYSLKTFLQNQYIKLAIGLACGTFFVSFAIFKTKSLIKGY